MLKIIVIFFLLFVTAGQWCLESNIFIFLSLTSGYKTTLKKFGGFWHFSSHRPGNISGKSLVSALGWQCSFYIALSDPDLICSSRPRKSSFVMLYGNAASCGGGGGGVKLPLRLLPTVPVAPSDVTPEGSRWVWWSEITVNMLLESQYHWHELSLSLPRPVIFLPIKQFLNKSAALPSLLRDLKSRYFSSAAKTALHSRDTRLPVPDNAAEGWTLTPNQTNGMLTRLPLTGFFRLLSQRRTLLYIIIISLWPAVHREADAPLMTRGGSFTRVKMRTNGELCSASERTYVSGRHGHGRTPAVLGMRPLPSLCRWGRRGERVVHYAVIVVNWESKSLLLGLFYIFIGVIKSTVWELKATAAAS